MANPLDSNEIVKQSNVRSFIQYGGPGSQRYFFGLDTEYHYIDGASIPTNGSIDPIYVPDPLRVGRFRLVGRQVSAPALPTVKLNFMESWGGIPRMLMAPRCEFNLYETHSRCEDPSDFYRGWAGTMLIYSGFILNDMVDLGTRSAPSSDELLMDGVSATGVAIYPVGQLSFGEEASAEVEVEVIDQVYGTHVQCANCGTPNDGSQFIYAITRANVGSPSAPGQLVYTLDGGSTWSTATITGIGTTNNPTYIDIVGNILFVGAGPNLFYTVLNDITGAPTTWSTIAMPATMVDVYVKSTSEIFFISTATGLVYKTSEITISPTQIDNSGGVLHRITGVNDLILVSGASGLVRYSRNAGVTWITATAPAAATIHAPCVIDERLWYVGSNAGNLYKSIDYGATWSTVNFPGYGTGAITDVVAATREVIWVAQNVSSVAYIVTSLDGGNSWINNTSGATRIANWPTFQQITRLAIPENADPAIAANYIAIGGLATGGADGILLAASPNIL